MIEPVLQRVIIAQLNQVNGVFVWRQNTGAVKVRNQWVRFGLPGQADITGCVGPKRLEIECKSDKGRLSPEQRAFGDRMLALGAVYIVARSLAGESGAQTIHRLIEEVRGHLTC